MAKFKIKRICFFDSVPMCLSAFVPVGLKLCAFGAEFKNIEVKKCLYI